MSEINKQHLSVKKLLSLYFKGVDNEDIQVESPDTKGDGYLSSILFAVVACKNKVYHLVIKLAPHEEEQRNFVNSRDLFQREVYFYTKIYPAIKEYQKEKLLHDGFSSVAQCYGTSLEDKNEALVLHDLKKLGYKLCDRKKPMDEYHVAKVLEEYGKLHGSSLALRNQDPKRFRDITDGLNESDVFGDIIHLTKGLEIYDRRFQHTAEMLKSKGYENEAEKINKFREQIPDVMMNTNAPNDVHSVILHGDCWCNNMMFKYEEGNPKPVKMCFLDFQLSRMGSPLLDFSYYFYTSAPKHALEDIDKYLNIYYESLCSCLQEYGCNPDDVFPYSVFIKHWQKYSKFGLVLSLLLFRFALCDKDEAPNLTDQDYAEDFMRPIKNEDAFNERVINVVKHFVNNNLI